MPTSTRSARLARRALLALALATPLACRDVGPDDGNGGFTGTLEAHFIADTVSPGESMEIRVHVPTRADNKAFTVIATYGGMARGVDTLVVPGQVGTLNGTLQVPAGAPDGHVWIAFAVAGTRMRDTAFLTVHDMRPPIVTGSLAQVGSAHPMSSMIPPDYRTPAGKQLAVHVEAIDKTSVRWIGYEFGPPFGQRDSTPVDVAPGVHGRVAFTLQIPESLAGSSPTITLFARDANGNRGVIVKGTVSFYRYLDRLTATATLDAAVRDVAYDAARERVYLSQPASSRVAVLSLATMSWLAPIATPAPPTGLDLTAGGDSLLVGLERSTYLGVVDLRAPSPAVDTVRLHYARDSTVGSGFGPVSPSPDRIRVAADGRVLVSLMYAGTTTPVSSQGLLTLDPATGAQALVPMGNGATRRLSLVPSGDRGTILVIGTPSGSGLLRYAAATREFVQPPEPLPQGTEWPLASSADASGRFYMLGRDLFDERVHPVRQIGIQGYLSHYTALSPDGADVYAANRMACTLGSPPPCPSDPGAAPMVYLRLGRAANALREVVRTPELATMLLPLPDGRRMIAIGASTVTLFDLTAAGARSWPPTTAAAVRAALSAPPEAAARRDATVPTVRWR